MNKTNKIILLAPLLIVIVILFVILNGKYREAVPIIPVNIENKWQTYQNYNLGFEIKYPTRIANYNATCELRNGIYQSMFGMVPVKIFEDNNAVYISHEYFYQDTADGCEKVNNSLALLANDYSWKILIQDNINNDEELNQFIKEYYVNYDGKCSLGEKKAALQDGVYDVYTAWDGKNLDESECLINGWTIMKYYPAKGKVAAWGIGSEANFWGDEKGDITYDQEMVDSFKFINN